MNDEDKLWKLFLNGCMPEDVLREMLKQIRNEK